MEVFSGNKSNASFGLNGNAGLTAGNNGTHIKYQQYSGNIKYFSSNNGNPANKNKQRKYEEKRLTF